MTTYRYRAIEGSGGAVEGVIEAEDRRGALQSLSRRGLFPSILEASEGRSGRAKASTGAARMTPSGPVTADDTLAGPSLPDSAGRGVRRKDVTAFTREMAALLGAAIPIPQALDGLADEEDNPAVKALVARLAQDVRAGLAFSAALAKHPRLFGELYASMVRVGEEAGALPVVMNDLADLLEHEEEIRSEVLGAVAYPAFVLGFGIVTVVILLAVVLPKLFSMLQEMLTVLPLPTLILLQVSGFLNRTWPYLLVVAGGAVFGYRWYSRTPRGGEVLDALKLRMPIFGPLFRAAALTRFARTLGILVKSGVSLLPALKIVEGAVGNRTLARQLAQVAEETRGGASLAAPLRRLGVFPKNATQMIAVGEESGNLDQMLLKVAQIEERHMRAKTKTIVSLLAPVLILVVGAVVGFMVIALLLPIFKMSRGVH